jgi:hypothetical protein
MPKAKAKSKSKSSDESITTRFHFVEATSYTNGVAAVPLNMNDLEAYCAAFAELSDLYRYWRLNHVKVTCVAWAGSGSVDSASPDFFIVHVPNDTTGIVTLGNLEGEFARGFTGMHTTGASETGPAVLVLERSHLHSNVEWFDTLGDVVPNTLTANDGPGIVDFVMRTTTEDGVLLFDVHIDVTFRLRLAPSLISAIRDARVAERVNAELVARKGQEATTQKPIKLDKARLPRRALAPPGPAVVENGVVRLRLD